jgi:hypothetical protein
MTLACSAALIVACNKGGGGAGGGPGGGGAAVQAAAAGALDLIPKDAALVVGVNWSKFKGTKFHNMIVSNLPAEAKTELDGMKAACGVDPLNDLDSVVVGVVGKLDKSSRAVIVVKGNWNRDKIGKCATAMGEKKGKKMTIANDGDIASYTPEGEKTMIVGWTGDLMVFTSTSMEGDKAFLSDVLKKSSSVKDNKPVMDLLGKTDSSATIYGAFLPPAGSDATTAFSKMTGGSEKLAGAYGTLKLASDLDMNMGFRFSNDAEAKAVADKMAKELEGAKASPQGGQFLGGTTVKADGADTVMAMKLDEKQLDQVTEMVKQMVPMLPMMLGGAGQ